MSQIAVVLRLVSPLVLTHPWICRLRALARALLRLAIAFGTGAAIYGLVLLLIVEAYPPTRTLAVIIYGIGMALATLIGICIATIAARSSQRHGMMLFSSWVAALLPFLLYMHNHLTIGNPRPLFVCYIIGGMVGSLSAVTLLARLPEMDPLSLIPHSRRLPG